MKLTLLHINIERSKHISAVTELIQNKRPDIICFEEAMLTDMELLSGTFGYNLAYAPLLTIKRDDSIDQQGSAILSRYPFVAIQKHRYDDHESEELPIHTEESLHGINGLRPAHRFAFHYTLLSTTIAYNETNSITVATTHFPVIDHYPEKGADHEFKEITQLHDIERGQYYRDKLVSLIRILPTPTIFTSDLNNTRGEYTYDLLAHELIDTIPMTVTTSIDPTFHRNPNLHLMVDAIMVSPDLSTPLIEVIHGISDHKGFIATFDL